jgi:hypothetical protein
MMFELDGIYDYKEHDGVHKVNLGIRTDGAANSVATGVSSDLTLAVFEAVGKAVSTPLLAQGAQYIPDPASVEYDPQLLTITLGSIREGVGGTSIEELAGAYLRLVQEIVSRLSVSEEV